MFCACRHGSLSEEQEQLQDRRSLVLQLRVATVVAVVLLCVFRPSTGVGPSAATALSEADAIGFGSIEPSISLRFMAEPVTDPTQGWSDNHQLQALALP